MQIDITPVKTEGLERLLEVSVPLPEVQEAEDRARSATRARCDCRASVPARRPPAMVRKKFAEAIRQEALEALVQAAFKEVIDREKLDLATQPHVHDVKFEEAQPLTFELHLEVTPVDRARRDTSGFRSRASRTPSPTSRSREQVETLRDQRATWTPVRRSRAGRHGDGAARDRRRRRVRCPRARNTASCSAADRRFRRSRS